MAEKKVIELEVKTNAASLKSQLREAQAEVQTLSEKFGVTSQEATAAARKAAELKDAIGDAKALTDAFNPDAKFNALSTSIGGVLNGFQAFEGALGLVGVEGEEVQKTLLKVQSAMALSEGINGIMAAKDSFVNLGAVIKTNLVAAFSSLKTAIITTGIGALVIAVGLLLPKIIEWADFTGRAKKKQDELNDSLEQHQKALRDDRDELQRDLDFKIKLAEAEGKSTEELLKLKESNSKKTNAQIYKEIEAARARLKALREADLGVMASSREEYDELVKKNIAKRKEVVKEIKDLKGQITANNQDLLIEKTKFETESTKITEKAETTKTKVIDEEAEKRKQEAERQRQEALANKIAQQGLIYEQLQAIEDAENEYYKNKKTQQQQELDDVNNKYFQLIEFAKANGKDTTALLEAQKEAEKEINDKYDKEAEEKAVAKFKKSADKADKEMAEEKARADAKIDVVRNTFSVIGGLAQAFAGSSEKEQKKAFEIQKAANIAGGVIDTIRATIGAFKSGNAIGGPILGFAQAGVAAAGGAVMIKNLESQQFSARGNVNTPNNTSNNNQVITPNFNIIGSQNQSQLSTLNQAPIKAYVVGSEVTTQQMLDKKKIQNATL